MINIDYIKRIPQTGSLPAGQQSVEAIPWLGWPRFSWSLKLVGLCIFTFVIVTYYVDIAKVGVTVGVLGLLVGKDRIRIPFPVVMYGAFLSWAFVGSFASPYSDVARDQLAEQLKQLVIMLIVINALRTEGQLRFYLLFFIGCFILFPARGALVNYVDGETIYGRALWNYIYNNPNDLAGLALLGFGIAFGYYSSSPPRTLVWLGTAASAIILFIVILLTQSRGAFLGLVIAAMPLLVKTAIKQPYRAFGAAVVVFTIAVAMPAGVWERLSGIQKLTSTSTLAEADKVGSAAERFEIQKIGWQILGENITFGVGLGAYKLAHAARDPLRGGKDTHNTYLNLAVETGVPGLVIWLVMVVSLLRYAHRARQRAAPGVLATQQHWIERALIGFLFAGIFGTYAALTFPYILFATLWCSATLLQKPLEETRPDGKN